MLNSKLFSAFLKLGQVCTDTRKIQKGDIFIALKGDRFNGNKFAAQALDAGAAFAVVDEASAVVEGDERYILVENALSALQSLARAYRDTWKIPVIGITGTNGKTTTKELFRAVLQTQFRVWATQGNLNNHIGVPLTILAKPKDTEVAVIEMGANKKGDIKELANISAPDFAIITNIGQAHLERFGDVDGVQKTKGELFAFIRNHSGKAWVNKNDPRVTAVSEGISAVSSYGTPDSDLFLEGQNLGLDGTEITVRHRSWSQSETFSSVLIGEHNVPNLVAAILCGVEMGISVENIRKGLASYVPTNNRTQIVHHPLFNILLDAYNANPSSMEAAIKSVFAQQEGKVGLALGDMFELGPGSADFHRQVGEFLNQFQERIEAVVFLGKDMIHAKQVYSGDNAYYSENDLVGAASFLKKNASLVDLLLIKGSRGMAMERILDYLEN